MKALAVKLIYVLGIVILSNVINVNGQSSGGFNELHGKIVSSVEWGSGYIKLQSAINLHKGDTLRIEIGKTAQKIVVRALSRGESPDEPVGIIKDFNVPSNRILIVPLMSNMNNILQISVHGRDPWDQYGWINNGDATIKHIYLKCNH